MYVSRSRPKNPPAWKKSKSRSRRDDAEKDRAIARSKDACLAFLFCLYLYRGMGV